MCGKVWNLMKRESVREKELMGLLKQVTHIENGRTHDAVTFAPGVERTNTLRRQSPSQWRSAPVSIPFECSATSSNTLPELAHRPFRRWPDFYGRHTLMHSYRHDSNAMLRRRLIDKNIFIKPFFIGINYCIGVIVSKLATIWNTSQWSKITRNVQNRVNLSEPQQKQALWAAEQSNQVVRTFASKFFLQSRKPN